MEIVHKLTHTWKISAWIICLFIPSAPLFSLESRPDKNLPVITSASEDNYPPFCLIDNDGQADGFSVELLKAALKSMGHGVEFRTGIWDSVRKSLVDGTVQVLPLVGRTPERENVFDFTFPYLHMHGTILVRSDDSDIHSLKDLTNRTVAVMKGDNAEEFAQREKISPYIIPFATFKDAIESLSRGKVDAVIIQKLLAMQLIKGMGLKNLRTTGPPLQGFTQSFCFAVRKGDGRLLEVLNEGLSIIIADGTFRRLQSKWFSPIESAGDERILVGGDENYPPYEFLDGEGKPAGYNVELTYAIAKHLGLAVDIRLGPWADIRKGLANGEIQAAQGMFYSAERARVFDFTPAHTRISHVAVYRKGSPKPKSMKDLAGKSVVVMEGDIMHEYALNCGIPMNILTTKSQEEALTILARGGPEYTLLARTPALYWIKNHRLSNLEVSSEAIISPEYCYGFSPGNETLLSSFTEGLQAVEASGEYREIYSKWLGIYDERRTDVAAVIKYISMVTFPLALLLIFLFGWSWLLKKKVAERTAALEQEILEHKRSETALKESERNFRSLFEGSRDALLVFDIGMGIVDSNSTFQALSGYSQNELTAIPLISLFPGPDYQIFSDIAHHLKTDSAVPFFEVNLKTKSGSLVPVELSVSNINDVSGHSTLFLSSFRDTTERKEIEMQLRQSEKMQAIGQLAGGIAHDFNNQLAAAHNFAELITRPSVSREDITTYADYIKQIIRHSADLTSQLLAFARKGKYRSVHTDMNKVVQDTVAILERSIDRKIHISCRLKAAPSATVGNPSQLQNAVLNLGLNARDAISNAGEILFLTSNQAITPAMVEKEKLEIAPGEYIRIQIRDTGEGMSAETLKHLFEPFFTTKPVGKGTGMGLAAVYGTMKNHNGAVTVESKPGQGTAITLLFPQA